MLGSALRWPPESVATAFCLTPLGPDASLTGAVMESD